MVDKPFNCTGAVYATGRRKSSVVKTWLKIKGDGKIFIRFGKKYLSIAEAFPNPWLQEMVMRPLKLTETMPGVDILCVPVGGGCSGQAGAAAHGISRALSKASLEYDKILRAHSMLTRDPRMVQPKQVGLYKGRRKPQSSKR